MRLDAAISRRLRCADEARAINAVRPVRTLVAGLFLLTALCFIWWGNNGLATIDHVTTLVLMLVVVLFARASLVYWLRYGDGPLLLAGLLTRRPLSPTHGDDGGDMTLEEWRHTVRHAASWLAL
jgi:hypothetical protein